MGQFTPDKVRTLALVGHGGSGKTSVAEAMLFNAGATSRMGKTDDGTTKTDYDADEIHRKISINSVPIAVDWKDCELNVVDCPGYVDFLPEVHSILKAMDAAVLVVNATSASEAQTEKVHDFCQELEHPLVCFVSKMDKENADFDKALKELKEDLGAPFVPLAIPIGAAADFKGYVDLLTRKAYTHSDDSGNFTEGAIDSSLEEVVEIHREALIEAAASADDALTEKYLEGEELSPEEIIKGIRTGVLARTLIPVIPGSGLHNAGVKHLMDNITHFLPSPVDRSVKAHLQGKDEEVIIEADSGQPVFGHIFKLLVEPHVGELPLIRIYSGTLSSGMHVLNTSRDEKEKIGAIVRLHGKERVEASELGPGQIGALLKLKHIHWGDSIAAPERPVTFPPAELPAVYMSTALKPATAQDTEKLSTGLSKLKAEDPFIRAEMDEVTHEFVVSGTGELHLDTFVRRLKDRFHINVETTKPKIPYRETVKGTAKAQGKHKKQSGGHGQFGDCWLRIEPLETGKGFEFVDEIVGGKIPSKFIPAVEKGVRETLAKGVIAGYPMTDVRVAVVEGSYHAVDSSEMAFKTAASKGIKAVAPMAKPILMEPVMNVEITVPEANMGDIMGDMNGRRGRILGMEPRAGKQVIKAQAPLAELYKYIITLRSMTGGRGEFTMQHSHYEEVPAAQATEVIKEAKHEAEDED